MSIGFIYAGQGTQKVGMGQDFYNRYEEFKATIDGAGKALENELDVDITTLLFSGPIEELSQTRNTQPAMVAFAIGITKLLKSAGIIADYSCGLSLGEYSSLYEAGVLSEKDVLRLVAKRGKYMENASRGRDVKMAAILGLDRDTVEECCKNVTETFGGEKIVQAANYNCPGQIVISGDAVAVDKASADLKSAGAKRILPLNVSGPFHTSLMKPAGEALAQDFKETEFGKMQTKVVFNCLGREKDDCETIETLLEKQVQSAVYLEDSIRYMEKQGVDTIIEIGPGNAISKFVKKTAPNVRVMSIDSVEDYENVVKELLA